MSAVKIYVEFNLFIQWKYNHVLCHQYLKVILIVQTLPKQQRYDERPI
jgi:hypothetical protein